MSPSAITPVVQQAADGVEILFENNVVARVLGVQTADLDFAFFVLVDQPSP
jgi:hypothetical protein